MWQCVMNYVHVCVFLGLTIWARDPKDRFKTKVKVIFEILIKKLGVDAVLALVPSSHTRLVRVCVCVLCVCFSVVLVFT